MEVVGKLADMEQLHVDGCLLGPSERRGHISTFLKIEMSFHSSARLSFVLRRRPRMIFTGPRNQDRPAQIASLLSLSKNELPPSFCLWRPFNLYLPMSRSICSILTHFVLKVSLKPR